MPIRRKRNDVGYSRWALAFPIERPYLRVIYDTHNTPFIFGVSLPDYIPYLKRSFPHFRTICIYLPRHEVRKPSLIYRRESYRPLGNSAATLN